MDEKLRDICSGFRHSAGAFSERVDELLVQQADNWPMLTSNLAALQEVEVRSFPFGHFEIKVQFNPARIRSSAAKVDAKSIRERPCFLCVDHLPALQKGVPFGDDLLVLCNPFAIFPRHLTIPALVHVPQSIEGHFERMLQLSQGLPDFMVFYNGPECGASAPDHLHFQAGNTGFLPIGQEFGELKDNHALPIFEDDELSVWGVKNYLRHFIAIETFSLARAVASFNKIYRLLAEKEAQPEPMMNVLCNYTAKGWQIVVFPRRAHRPSHYFATGDKQILLSPAAVDFGGVCILPREEDFLKITASDLEAVFREVSITEVAFDDLRMKLIQSFGEDFKDRADEL